jgi:hypothetical protein
MASALSKFLPVMGIAFAAIATPSAMLGGNGSIARRARAFDPEVVAFINLAFRAVFADLGISDRDDAIALRFARRIIELAFAGERGPERLKATTFAWMPEQA